jgi:hypothetical protein
MTAPELVIKFRILPLNNRDESNVIINRYKD